MAVWTGGLGISNSGSEADQCVTAESFNLSLIMAAFLHPLQRPAGKEELGFVAHGDHMLTTLNQWTSLCWLGGWHLSTLLSIRSPRSKAMCNEACDTKYLAMNNYNLTMADRPQHSCEEACSAFLNVYYYIDARLWIFTLNIWFELNQKPLSVWRSNTREANEKKPEAKPVLTSVERRGRFHCVHLDWHQQQSLVSDLLDSHGN